MSSHQRVWPGIVMAFASALCFSTLAIFVKLAFSYQLSVTTVVVLRMTLASIFLWLTMLLTKRGRWKISRQDWLIFPEKLFAVGHLGVDAAAGGDCFRAVGLEQSAALY